MLVADRNGTISKYGVKLFWYHFNFAGTRPGKHCGTKMTEITKKTDFWYRIKRMKKGKPFVRSILAENGSRSALDKALSMMVKAGQLERITRGVYMRPKASKYTGTVKPSPIVVMQIIAKANDEKIQIHGSEAVRMLGLSTQMQMLPTFYTSGRTRVIRVGNAKVRLRHACDRRLQFAGTRLGIVVSALYYIGSKGLTDQVLEKLIRHLNEREKLQLQRSKISNGMKAKIQHYSTK